jgi:phosphoenolpyruvate carboxykinase (ATP)
LFLESVNRNINSSAAVMAQALNYIKPGLKRPVIISRGQLGATLQPCEVTYAGLGNLLSSGGSAKNIVDDGINKSQKIFHNPPVPVLYEQAYKNEHETTVITSTGAMLAFSGAKTGRSPKDKRVVAEDLTEKDIWWGPVNIKLESESFLINRERAIDYLNQVPVLYVIDGFAGWDNKWRMKIRIVCSRAYHALFMHDMLIRPTEDELRDFGTPDFTIYNAGCFPANRHAKGMTSATTISLDFSRKEMVILGTQYAGEMKKGILTLMMYWMPKRGQLCLHSSCNEGHDGKMTLFFGLSGTGKTTLSADPKRYLIGDDEHVWSDDGVFNVEGGCYAKCIGLRKESEPEIYDAIRYGAVVENAVMYDDRTIDFDDKTVTENTRVAYPLEFVPNAKFPAMGGHPNNIILLTCDAFGVLPPVSKLTIEQVMYQFISGYTAKVAGTESGITEPTPTFSACFGGPFLVWHPIVYAKMLATKLQQHDANAWMVNTGWVGGRAGSSGASRIKLKYSRAMVDAINNGSLAEGKFKVMPGFGFLIPESVPEVPDDLLSPWLGWGDQEKYRQQLNELAQMFRENMNSYKDYDQSLVDEVSKAQPTSWGEYKEVKFTRKFGMDG